MEEVKVVKQKRGFMDWYFKSNLLLRILFGLILGAIVGLIVGPKIAVIKPFGDLLIRLLQMIVVPVVFFSLITGSASICLLYTSDAADDLLCVDLGGRRIIKKKKKK